MLEAIAFQTRARTIDHLGREQIADCPTAISELWKNAYDAYARNVELHIFDGAIPVALLADDGHGMSRVEFIEKWLVVGTESKASDTTFVKADQNGLPFRERQGQKGIGRLSSAALGPLLLVVSKRSTSRFVASMIDWRLFENPFLFLQDIEIPVVEFDDKDELLPLVASMADRLMGNIWGTNTDDARNLRLAKSWERFDEMKRRDGRPSTREAIENAIVNTSFEERHLEKWSVWTDGACGTALLVADISYDLEAQLPSRVDSSDAQTATQAKSRLFQTLSNFTDPFIDRSNFVEKYSSDSFDYSVTAWDGALSRVIISRDRSFMLEDLEDLEHVVEGTVDNSGIFTGRVKAFGKWLDGPVVLPPKTPVPTRVDSSAGPFQFRLGTFEQLASSSSHAPEIHSKLEDQARLYAGFMVYRNGLRVMPYGREDNDFFEIEKRRSLHAGREFWSIRRVFGRVALTRENNPNLKDKAGREGIIDNKAAKVFRDIVENILMITARRFFGTDSAVRKELLPDVKAAREKELAEAARKKVRNRKRREFRKNLTEFLVPMGEIAGEVEEMAFRAREGDLPTEQAELLVLRERLYALKEARSEMAIGTPPSNLGALESTYAEFRQRYVRSGELITQLSDSFSSALLLARPQSQREIVGSELSRNAVFLQNRLRKWSAESRSILSSEQTRVAEFVDTRNKSYHAETLVFLEDLELGRADINLCLAKLEVEKERQDKFNSEFFESYLSTLRNLEERIDLESLINASMAESEQFEDEIGRLNSLAQLGITVEIVGHEIEGLDHSIERSLKEISSQIRSSTSYQNLKSAHEALSSRLKFLSPLKLSGEKSREWISGEKIYEYCLDFLEISLKSNKASLVRSDAFASVRIYDQLSRILPVFINLINNSIYWVGQKPNSERKILLDAVDTEVFISDDGPGIEAGDVKSLFSLFFTRKTRGGRGVGLYLCRANLAAGGNTIRYIEQQSDKRLDGANFAIQFKGMENG